MALQNGPANTISVSQQLPRTLKTFLILTMEKLSLLIRPFKFYSNNHRLPLIKSRRRFTFQAEKNTYYYQLMWEKDCSLQDHHMLRFAWSHRLRNMSWSPRHRVKYWNSKTKQPQYLMFHQ